MGLGLVTREPPRCSRASKYTIFRGLVLRWRYEAIHGPPWACFARCRDEALKIARWEIARWKIALGLAIVAAMAAPFALGTWQPHANAQNWIALTPELRASIVAKLDSSKNCRYFETQVEARDVLGLKVDSNDILDAIQCHREQDT